jgi:hypothetical protein
MGHVDLLIKNLDDLRKEKDEIYEHGFRKIFENLNVKEYSNHFIDLHG